MIFRGRRNHRLQKFGTFFPQSQKKQDVLGLLLLLLGAGGTNISDDACACACGAYLWCMCLWCIMLVHHSCDAPQVQCPLSNPHTHWCSSHFNSKLTPWWLVLIQEAECKDGMLLVFLSQNGKMGCFWYFLSQNGA